MAVSGGTKLWIIAITVVVLSVKSQSQYVFNATVNTGPGKFTFYFWSDKFIEFYNCLCRGNTAVCSATADVYGVVKSLQALTLTPDQLQTFKSSNRYYCERNNNLVSMSCHMYQLDHPNCSSSDNCYSYQLNDKTISCDTEPVGIIWNQSQPFGAAYDTGIVDIKKCEARCLNPLSASQPISPTTTETPVSATESTKATVLSTMKVATTDSTATSPTSNQSFDRASLMLEGQSDNGDKTSLIVGVVVSLAVVAGILVVVGVVIWKRRRTAAPNKIPNTNRNQSRATVIRYSIGMTPHNTLPRNSNPVASDAETDTSAYPYAIVTPRSGRPKPPPKKYVGNPGAEDPGYYNKANPDDCPSTDYASIIEVTRKERNPHVNYYNLAQGQNGISGNEVGRETPVRNDLNEDSEENVYAEANDDLSSGDAIYSDVYDPNEDRPVVMDIQSGYSKLHDPARQIKELYNPLPSDNDAGNQSSMNTPSSASDQIQATDKQVQPITKSSAQRTRNRPITIVSVGPGSVRPIKAKDSEISSESPARESTNTEKSSSGPSQLDQMPETSLVTIPKEEGLAGQSNDYFELESDYDYNDDSDWSDTVQA